MYGWQHYNIRPISPHGKPMDIAHNFYAPSLDSALAMARARWPFASDWQTI